jgi:hypothetical protein
MIRQFSIITLRDIIDNDADRLAFDESDFTLNLIRMELACRFGELRIFIRTMVLYLVQCLKLNKYKKKQVKRGMKNKRDITAFQYDI